MATTSVKPLNSTYTFSSQPKVIQQQESRQKFRQSAGDSTDESNIIGNLMHDRRVIRGNTYARQTLPTNAQPDPIEVQRQHEAKRRALARRKLREQMRTKTPEPVQGRRHIDVQTELYLQELSDRVEEIDIDVQTDAFLDRPSSPLFIPQSTGKDMATQIETGDLFDFDLEVKPIVEILVGKTVEQALIEVAEEEELAAIREQQRDYEELRNAEMVELQRLEEQENRLRREKSARKKQAEEALRLEHEMAEKIAARAFAKAYLQDIVPSVFNNLRENGYFYDPIEHEIETSFMPWLINKTMTQVNNIVLGRTILDSIIRDIVPQRIESYDKLEEILRQTIERGFDMGTSAGDIAHRSESVQRRLIYPNENVFHDEIEMNAIADETNDNEQ